MANKEIAYERLCQAFTYMEDTEIAITLCNYFSTTELEELLTFIEEENNNV